MGWRRALVALVSGALSSLAMEPFNGLAGAVRNLPGRDLADRRLGRRRLGGVPAAALAGWLFGFGYFVPELYSIGHAFLVDPPNFASLMPFAVIGLPTLSRTLYVARFALARLIWTKDAALISRSPRRLRSASGCEDTL